MMNITDAEKAVLAAPGANVSILSDRVEVTLPVRTGISVCASGSSASEAVQKALALKDDLERRLAAT